ncbi:hypothetical protein EZV62_008219 [Acer yangbiense]|uniref:50S ribosomal protein L33, chloroplastic n=1 Tax=Acer yangbiense TaxID=1000413 RepID=A0A5C7ICR5_9ROSI|nr:hypothetical protein EZV62_008219 [Acer yangbiense]
MVREREGYGGEMRSRAAGRWRSRAADGVDHERCSSKMGDKKKTFMFVRLVSAAGTGFFYVKKKSSKKLLEKLEFRKYDPRVNRHVMFTKAKMK